MRATLRLAFGRDIASIIYGYLIGDEYYLSLRCLFCLSGERCSSYLICDSCYKRWNAGNWWPMVYLNQSDESYDTTFKMFRSWDGVDIAILKDRVMQYKMKGHKTLRLKIFTEMMRMSPIRQSSDRNTGVSLKYGNHNRPI